MNAEGQQRKQERKNLRANPDNGTHRKALKEGDKNPEKVCPAVLRFFRAYLHNSNQVCVRKGDESRLQKHIKITNVEGKQDYSSKFIKDEGGNFLKDVALIGDRFGAFVPF